MTTVKIMNTGMGKDALTGKECDGLTVAFGDGPARFLSWKSFKQLTTMEVGADKEGGARAGAIVAADKVNGVPAEV